MAFWTRGVASFLFAALVACSGKTEGVGKSEGKTDLFKETVLPLLAADCSGGSCHSPGGAGATFLTVSTSSSQTYQSLKNTVTAGNWATSPLATSMGEDYASPQTLATLKAWVEGGAEQYGEPGSLPAPNPPSYAGLNVCTDYCHPRQAGQWLESPHGNAESINSFYQKYDAGLLNTGFPTVGDLGEPECAMRCHDPLSDGRSFLTVGFTGDRPRPVIGCESCHGAGGDHYGAPKTPPPYATPDAYRCGQCHNETPADFGEHARYHPEGIDIKAEFLASPHARSKNEHVFATVKDQTGASVASKTDVIASCSRCHTDEGARALAWVAPTYAEVNREIPYASPPLVAPSTIECRTCHKVHDEGELWVGENATASAEYNTCVNCHATSDAFHGTKSSYSWTRTGGATSPTFLYSGSPMVIYDTHGSDDPATPAKIEGYALRTKNGRACRDCHNVHSADNTRANQWASSGHGGHLAEAKKLAALATVTVSDPTKTPDKEGLVPTVFAAGSVGLPTGAMDEVVATWAHYDWDAPDRQACQKCHTATGLTNYLASGTTTAGVFTFDPALYNPAKNDFSHLSGWTGTRASDGIFSAITTSGQNEMLYCWGCHKDNQGGVRNPGRISPSYDRWNSDGTGAPQQFIDGGNLGLSNVCAASCHSGRGNGGNVASIFAVTGALASSVATSAKPADYPAKVFPRSGPAAFSPTQTHYMNAVATLKHAALKPGYEYPGADYANKPWFGHDLAAKLAADPSSEGPCVTCHMAGGAHTLSPFAQESGEPVGACSVEGCHVGQYAVTRASIEEEEEAFKEAKALLKEELKAKGTLFKAGAYPYFFECYLPGATGGNPGAELPGAVQFRKWTDWTKWPVGSDLALPVEYSAVDLGVDPANAARHLYAFTYGATGGDEGFAGAAHNLSYLTGEAGAFVHDSVYAKRLLFDSIYYMRNHASPQAGATLDLSASPKVAAWFAPGAIEPGAVARP